MTTTKNKPDDWFNQVCAALGLFDGARPVSPQAVLWDEVLPTIEALKANNPEAGVLVRENERAHRLWRDALARMVEANQRADGFLQRWHDLRRDYDSLRSARRSEQPISVDAVDPVDRIVEGRPRARNEFRETSQDGAGMSTRQRAEQFMSQQEPTWCPDSAIADILSEFAAAEVARDRAATTEEAMQLVEHGIPRRNRIDLLTPAEKAIRDTIHAVEAVGASVQLTDAVVLLGAALDSVADHIEGIATRRYVSSESAEARLWAVEGERDALKEALGETEIQAALVVAINERRKATAQLLAAQEAQARLRAALEKIRDDAVEFGDVCECEHGEGCCARVGFHCPVCIAALALLTPARPESTEKPARREGGTS